MPSPVAFGGNQVVRPEHELDLHRMRRTLASTMEAMVFEARRLVMEQPMVTVVADAVGDRLLML